MLLLASMHCQYGTQVASLHIPKRLAKVNKIFVHSIKLSYLGCAKEKRKEDSDKDVTTLPHKKRDRHFLLGDCIDEQLQLYLKKIHEHGGIITASVVVAAAWGILISQDKSLLKIWWSHCVRRKATTSKCKHTPEDFEKVKERFLDDLVSIVEIEEIPPELILNWDQTDYSFGTSIWLDHGSCGCQKSRNFCSQW